MNYIKVHFSASVNIENCRTNQMERDGDLENLWLKLYMFL